NVVFRSRDASGNIGSAASAITVLPPVGGGVDTPNTPIVPTNADNVPQAITVSFATVTQPGLLTADAMAAPAPPPVGFRFAGAGAPQTVEATSAAGASVTLSGTGTDPDGDTLSFRWTEGTVEVGTTATVTALLPIGAHSLVLTVSDGQESSTSTTLATVRDT